MSKTIHKQPLNTPPEYITELNPSEEFEKAKKELINAFELFGLEYESLITSPENYRYDERPIVQKFYNASIKFNVYSKKCINQEACESIESLKLYFDNKMAELLETAEDMRQDIYDERDILLLRPMIIQTYIGGWGKNLEVNPEMGVKDAVNNFEILYNKEFLGCNALKKPIGLTKYCFENYERVMREHFLFHGEVGSGLGSAFYVKLVSDWYAKTNEERRDFRNSIKFRSE